MEPTLFALALLAYLAVAALRLPGLVPSGPRAERAAELGLWFAPAAHLLGVVALGWRLQTLPLSAAGPWLLSLSAMLGVANLALRRQPRAEVLAGVVAALCATLLGLGLLLPGEVALAPSGLGSVWFPVHAAMIFLGLLGFALAFGVSGLYLVVRHRLKRKQLSDLGRLPSIDALDQLNTRFVLLGFLALTVGIAAGGLWAASRATPPGSLGPTVAISLVMWGWYAAAVLVRVVGGWRGQLAAHFSLVGFVGVLVGLGAIALSRPGWHE